MHPPPCRSATATWETAVIRPLAARIDQRVAGQRVLARSDDEARYVRVGGHRIVVLQRRDWFFSYNRIIAHRN